MQSKALISQYQKVTSAFLNSIGAFARKSIDDVVRDFVTDGKGYVGFLVTQASPSEVTIAAGRMTKNGEVYFREDTGGVTISLLNDLPAVAQRYATIIAYGNAVDTGIDARTFLIDVDTRQTEGREVATENRRVAYLDKVLGQENATPSKPAIDANYVAIADVLLSPAGIVSIGMRADTRVPSVKDNRIRIVALEAFQKAAGTRIETLGSDISGLAMNLATKASARSVRNVAADVARLKEKADIPDDYTDYGADYYLDTDESDTAHPDFNCLVEEGIRFALAAVSKTQLALGNPLDPSVIVNANLMLPRYISVPRISQFPINPLANEYPLTTTTVETTELVQLTETRTVQRIIGNLQQVCTNGDWFRAGVYDPVTRVLHRNGETFNVTGAWEALNLDNLGQHDWISIQQFREEKVVEPYWDRVTVPVTVTGSQTAYSFRVTQDGFLTELDLLFTKLAAAGDVRVVIGQTRNGRPDDERVLNAINVSRANMKAAPEKTKITTKPLFVAKGDTIYVSIVSSAAHFISRVEDTNGDKGVLWYKQDGVWEQDQNARALDLAIEMRFAEFESPHVVVGLGALELAGGMDGLSINADMIRPDSTSLYFEVRVNGEWRVMQPMEGNFFQGTPSLCQLRARFVGSKDVMPMLGVGPRSQVDIRRFSDAFSHISVTQTLAAASDVVELRLRLEGWDADHNTHTPTLLTGGAFSTIETADTVVDTVPFDDPNALIRIATFNLPAPVAAYKIKQVGTSTAGGAHFHVAERVRIDFTN